MQKVSKISLKTFSAFNIMTQLIIYDTASLPLMQEI